MFRQNDWEFRLGDKYVYEKNLTIIATSDRLKGSLFKLITEKKDALILEILTAVKSTIGEVYQRRTSVWPLELGCMKQKPPGFNVDYI